MGPGQMDDTGSTTASDSGSGTAMSSDGADSTGDETGGPPPAVQCQPAPPITPEPPPGSECSPGTPQTGGLCHDVITLQLPEELVTSADLFDVDGDGLPDITMVGTDWVGTAVSIEGAWPRLSAISSLSAYQGPGAAADLDDDGAPELIVGRTPLSIYSGTGDGGFVGRVGTPVPAPVIAAAAADVDGDGLDDLVVAHDDGTISSLRSTGGGRLATEWVRSSACLNPVALTHGDFDGDGTLDLAVSTTSGTVNLLVGDGTGAFTLGGGREVNATGTTMAAGDLDGDGRSEIVVADREGSAVHVLRMDDGAPAVAETIALSDPPSAVLLADLQGDGIADVVTGHADALAVSWAWGVGDGTFEAPGRAETIIPTGRIYAEDIDGDGYTDVVGAEGSGNLVRLLGGPSGELVPAGLGFVMADMRSFVLGDLSGDGIAEQISVSTIRAAVSPGMPDGSLGPPQFFGAPDAHHDLHFVVRADLDGDPIPDVFVVGDELTTMARRGNGSGSLTTGITTEPAGYAEAFNIEVADFDEDGRPDLLVNSDSSIRVWHSDGAGGLLPGATIAPLMVSRNPLITTDLNADGHTDVVWASLGDSLVTAVLGDGSGGFGPPQITDVGPGETEGIAVGDLDEDGLPDAVVGLFGTDDVAVAYGLGDGTFSPPEVLLLGSFGRAMLGDFNGDGHLDVGAYDWLGADLVVAVGAGDGTFSPGPTFPMDFIHFPITGDLNGDGLDDALLRADYSTVRLLISNPCGCGA